MYSDPNERPSIDEAYQTASTTSDLRVEADRRSSADVLIAAGWSSSRVGMALLRLHSEYDSSEKPNKPTPDSIAAMAGTFQRTLPGQKPPEGKPLRLTPEQARNHAAAWYAHEVGMLLGKMKALPDVRQQIASKAARWGMEDGHSKAAAVIRYWLDQTCGGCHGLKWELIPGSPALSNKPCRVCAGGGFVQAPHGQEGRKLANWMDSCVEDARGVLRSNLSSMRRARNN